MSEKALTSKRLVCFDLIRIFSCLCVTVVHFNASVSGWAYGIFVYANSIVPNYYFGDKVYLGGIGVSLFFILSGATQMLTYREDDVFAYYKKRLYSLFPMFWIAFACATIYDLLFYKAMGAGTLFQFANSIFGMDGYLATLGFLGYDFYKVGEWFLGCILLLYAVFPLLYMGMKKLPVLTVSLSVAIYVFFECHPYIGNYSIQGIEFFIRIPEFLFGMIFVKYRLWENKKPILMTVAFFCVFGIALAFRNQLSSTTVTVLFCMLLFSVLSLCARILRHEGLNRILAKVSGLTYPIFLTHHFLINKMVNGFALDKLSHMTVAGLFAAYIIGSTVLSIGLKRINDRIAQTGYLQGRFSNILWSLVMIGVVISPVTTVTKSVFNNASVGMLPAATAVYDGEVLDHNTPRKVKRGELYNIDITVSNTGKETWSEAKQVRLCVWQDGADWGYRLLIPEGVEVAPGETYTFRLEGFGAPPAVDSTYLEYQMLQEGVQYFGEKERVDIAIEGTPDGENAQPEAETHVYDGEILKHNTPRQVKRGEFYNIDITVSNTGKEVWSEAKQIRLCVWQDGADWGYRLLIPEGVEVAPGETYTFRLEGFGAPPDVDSTYLEYQMLQEGVQYFGEKERVDIAIEGLLDTEIARPDAGTPAPQAEGAPAETEAPASEVEATQPPAPTRRPATSVSFGDLDGRIVSHTTPEEVNRLGLYTIEIVAENTGRATWSEDNRIRLAILQDGADYGYRIPLAEGVEVKPGEQTTFQLVGFGAPPTGSSTDLVYQMIQEDGGLFGTGTQAHIDILD